MSFLVSINDDCRECVPSCDEKPYLHNEIKGGICIKIQFNPFKNISLLHDGRHFFVYVIQTHSIVRKRNNSKYYFSPLAEVAANARKNVECKKYPSNFSYHMCKQECLANKNTVC